MRESQNREPERTRLQNSKPSSGRALVNLKALALAAGFTLLAAVPALAGEWKQEGDQWYYEQDGAYLHGGWEQINGKWYYFKDSGVMAADETVEGYYVGPDGAWVENQVSRYEKEGDSTADIISSYLEKDTRYAITLEELVGKNPGAYRAGTGSVYGKALNQAELDQVAQKVHQIVTSYITMEMNDVQKLDLLYSYLINTCTYAPTWDQNRANTAWGALIYREAQCSGYARGFKALCDAVDIPCYYVHATEAASNPSHQWNIVQIGGKWYHVDTQACIFLVSDAVYANMGMAWNRAEFPECPESFFPINDQIQFAMPYTPGADWIRE